MALGKEEQRVGILFVMNFRTFKALDMCGIPLQKAHDVWCHVQLETAQVRHTHSWNAGHALTRGGKGQRFLRQNRGGEKSGH